jgi:hypothetical protein
MQTIDMISRNEVLDDLEHKLLMAIGMTGFEVDIKIDESGLQFIIACENAMFGLSFYSVSKMSLSQIAHHIINSIFRYRGL